MKKAYQKPQLEAFEMTEAFLLGISGDTKADKNAAVLSKGRGDYEEDDFVESIWK